METKRQAKFGRQIQKDLSEIFLREGKTLFGNSFISVPKVRVTPDLGYVKVYLTFLNEKEPQKMVTLVRSFNRELRTMLAQRLKNEVRKIPELEFYYDDTLDYVAKMDELFDKIHKEDEERKGTFRSAEPDNG